MIDTLDWKERALKLEYGFKELSALFDETEDLRNLLEKKILENQLLQSENNRLKELMNDDTIIYNSNHKDTKYKDQQIFKLENQIQEKDNLVLKLKREIESLNRKLKLREDELHRSYQTRIEDLQIAHKNEQSDNLTERNNFIRRIQELEQIVQFRAEENNLLNNELQLKSEQIFEMQNHNKLVLECKTKEFRESLNGQSIQYNAQIKQLEDQLSQYKRSQDGNLNELESLLTTRNQQNQKLNDLVSTNQHLILENEGLKSTLLLFQKQKDQDDYMYEDQKKKETLHLKRYYETLLEQVERENRSLRMLLEQKSRELEELWSQPQNKRF